MRSIRRILVAVKDPGAKSLPAVDKGAELAHALGADLELFHGIATPLAPDTSVYMDGGLAEVERMMRAKYLAQLEALAVPLRRDGLNVNVSTEWDFPVYESIVRQAQRVEAGLIVAECHAGRRFAPWLVHLTDWELLRTSPMPVLLVKSPHAYQHPVVLAALDPTHAFAKPARLDSEILRAARMFSDALQGSLHAMHAYGALRIGVAPMAGASSAFVAGAFADAEVNAKVALDRALRATKIPAGQRHLVCGAPVDAIPGMARDIGCSLVVMGAVSRSGLRRLLIGNTAERVVSALTCDILVVKPARFVTRVSRKGRGVHFMVTPQMPIP
jgi:universal stress protein E